MQGQAKAILTYNIFERGSDVVIEANGSLLPYSRISKHHRLRWRKW